MLDPGTVRIVAAALVAVAAAGVVAIRPSVLGPRGRVVASRTVGRAWEAAWLAATMVAQAWTLGVILLPTWFYAWPAAGNFPGSTDLQVLGLAGWLAGMALAGWGVRTLGRATTVGVQVTEGQPLVQTGPYARMRHPIYTANVSAAAGLAILYLSLPLGAVVLLLAALASRRGRLEDEFLRSPQAFGDAYIAYARRTGRFLPRWRRSGP